jgi:uncharacterized membrane protein
MNASRLALAGIVILAIALRFYGLGKNTLWYDEFCSIECSSSRGLFHETLPMNQLIDQPIRPTSLVDAPSWPRIWTSLDREQHPPLYFILLRFWRDIFGDSEFAMRSLSALFGVTAVLLLYDAGKNLFSIGPALWASLLLALCGPAIDFSMQVRGYMPVLAMILGAMAALGRIVHFGMNTRRLLAFSLCIFAAMLTHYFAIGPIAAIVLYAIITLRDAARKKIIFAVAIAAGIYLLCWGPMFWQQRANFERVHEYLGDTSPDHTGNVVRAVLVTPARFLDEPTSASRIAADFAAVLYVLPFFFLRKNPANLLLGLMIVFTVGLVAILDETRHTAQLSELRYTLPAAPAIFLLVSALPLSGAKWLKHAIPSICAFACLFSIPKAHRPWDGDWRISARALEARSTSGDAVIIAAGGRGDWYANWLYLGISHYIPAWPGAVILMNRTPTSETIEKLRAHRRIWLIAGVDADPQLLLPQTRATWVGGQLLIAGVYQVEFPDKFEQTHGKH